MKCYSLNIAGYIIRFESSDRNLDLIPSERFLRNICNNEYHDVLIIVHSGRFSIPNEAKKVFNAPYVEEINGITEKKRDKFWSIHKLQNDLFIKTVFPLSSFRNKAVLKFSLYSPEWDLWIEGAGTNTDPLEYPLDGLILYYLTVIKGDIFIHASGINHSGRGYLFSGISGKGKSTMAKLWNLAGSRVIHDDRLIIHNTGSGFKMFNTPIYNNDNPSESPLDRIYLIDHGSKNEIIPVKGAAGVSLIMANCIQHNWDPEIVAKLLGSVSMMCASVPAARLLFRPDRSVIDHILENEY
jgi:hypothetical protein